MKQAMLYPKFIGIVLFVGLFTNCRNTPNVELLTEDIQDTTLSYLLTPEMSLFEQAVALRQAIADTLDTGFKEDSLCDNFAGISFTDFVVDSFLVRFARNTGTGNCGLAASILSKAMNNYGIEAYTYNFGFDSVHITHVIVIANTDNRWTVHDPFYNYSITDSTGTPKDFFTLLDELAEGNHANIGFSEDTVMRDVYLNRQLLASNLLNEKCRSFLNAQLQNQKDSQKIRIPVCYSCGIDPDYCPELNLWHKLSKMVHKKGWPDKAIYGLLFQINGVWGPNPEQFQSKIDSTLNFARKG